VFFSTYSGILLSITALLLSSQISQADTSTSSSILPTAQISPHKLTSGKIQPITVQTPTAAPIQQLFLSPGGPTITQTWALPHPGLDLSWNENLIYIAAGDGGLIIVDSNNHDNPVLARLSVGDRVNKISLSHQHAWLAAQGGLYTVDVHDPESPRTLAFTNTASAVTALASSDEYAALVQGREIQLFDSKLPGKLQSLATLSLDVDSHAIAIDQHHLYIAAGKSGVLRYRITDDHQLIAAGLYRTTGSAIDIRVNNGIAVVATQEQGLTLLDVTDSQHLRWLGSHQQAGRVQRLSLNPVQNQVMLLNERHQLLLIDISNPGLPAMLSSLQLTHAGSALSLHDNSVMTLVGDQLQLLDFTSTPPQLSNEGLDFGQGVNYGGERRIFIRDDIAYVADWFSGIHLYDISTPQQPRLLSTFHTEGSPKGIVVRDNYAYVADDDHGLQVINVKNPRRPFRVAELTTPGLAYIPVLDGNRLYLAGHRGGFQIIDISNPENPALIGQYDTAGKTWAIRIRNNIAYIADDNSGLMMFDVSQADNIRLLGQFSPGGDAEDVILHNNIAYVAFFDRGLYIIDISDPGYPKKIGHIQTPGNARGLTRDGSILYIADWLSGIQVIDISAPSQPRTIGSYDTDGAAWGLALKNQFAFIMDWWGGFSVLDISQPATPTLAGRYHHRDYVKAISVQEKIAYTATGQGGLQLYDIKNPLNPTWMTGIDFKASATDVTTNATRAYVALADRHIAVININDPFAAYSIREIRAPYPIADLSIQGPWLYASHGEKGMTLYRIDGKYADKPRKKRQFKSGINSVVPFGEHSLAIAQTDGLISIYTQADDKQPLQQFSQPSTLLRAYHDYLISYNNDTGIRIVDTHGEIISSIALDQTVIDMQIQDSTLYLVNDQQQITAIELGDVHQPMIKARYLTLSPLTGITAANNTLYLSGNRAITALHPLPDISWKNDSDGQYILTLADDMPTGSYNIEIDNHQIANAISIELPLFSKPRFSMDDLNKALDKMRQQQTQP
jgi:hypothetical protein